MLWLSHKLFSPPPVALRKPDRVVEIRVERSRAGTVHLSDNLSPYNLSLNVWRQDEMLLVIGPDLYLNFEGGQCYASKFLAPMYVICFQHLSWV